MSIWTLREKGLAGVVMRYEDGGKIQVYVMGEKEVRVGPRATDDEIIAAFKEDK